MKVRDIYFEFPADVLCKFINRAGASIKIDSRITRGDVRHTGSDPANKR